MLDVLDFAPSPPRSTTLRHETMSKEENSSKMRESKKNKRKHSQEHLNCFENGSSEQMSSINQKHKKPGKQHLNVANYSFPEMPHKKMRAEKPSFQSNPSKGKATSLRKRVDPETMKYFLEIAQLFESNGVDIEVLPSVCGNALEETRGKEVELATDMIISRTLQCLLEGCDLEQLCAFVRSSADGFPLIAVDKFGSHVAETALKSLAMHLEDDSSYSMVEEALHKICQVVVADAVNIMCSRYGSHVLRSLLCLSKGVPLDALEEFHVTKPSAILAERLSCLPSKPGGSIRGNLQYGVPDTFKFLVQEIMNHVKDEISVLRADKYSSFVLQSVLKLSVGDDQLLLQAILILLGSQEKSFVENRFKDSTKEKLKEDIMGLLQDTASSHLLEVIINVAPEALYNELLDGIFRGSLVEISYHQFGNFAVQSLISSARTREQVNLIWEELGPHLGQLLEAGKPGVVASILAACQRLQTHVNEFCQALTAAACPESVYLSCIVPHLLHLASYFRDKSHWTWPFGEKMHVLGCLMLQNLFKNSNQSSVRPYIVSITSMEPDYVLETAKDVGGSHVLEAFLCSDASAKQKLEVITKLKDHFGELSMNPSGSFTVEKCFTASNMPMKETIAVEVLNVQLELSKTKHGLYLLKKLDIEGYARRPEQWKLRQASKATACRDFLATFGSKDQASLSPETSQKASKKKWKRDAKMTGHANACSNAGIKNSSSSTSLGSGKPGLSSGGKHGDIRQNSSDFNAVKKQVVRGFIRNSMKARPAVNVKSKNKKSSASELADLAGKSKLSQGDVQKLFDPRTLNDKKQQVSLFLKKQKR